MSLKNFRSSENPTPGEDKPKVYGWDHRRESELPSDWLQAGEDRSDLKEVVCTPSSLYEWARFFATSTGTDPNALVDMTYEDVVELAANGAYGEGNWVVVRNEASAQPVSGWLGRPATSQVLLDLVYRPEQV
jgi:hypothetical protein